MLKNELLKKVRKEKGISLARLSELTGIAKSTLHRYENGESIFLGYERRQERGSEGA